MQNKHSFRTKATTTTIRRSCRKSKVIFIICACGFICSLFAQVVVSNQYAVKGTQLESLLERQTLLEKDVYALELKISQLSSLSYVETQAKKLGFIPSGAEIVYLQSPSFALNLK
jgi:hypothetical protein